MNRSLKRHRPKGLRVHRQPEQKRKADQEHGILKERLQSWLPTDTKTFLFELVAVTYLVIGVIHFDHTGDTSMLTTLLTYAAAYVGLTEVKPLFFRGKREDNPQPPKAEQSQ